MTRLLFCEIAANCTARSLYVLCALSRILSGEATKSFPVRCATRYFSLSFQAHLQNLKNPDCNRLRDPVGLRIEQAVEVHHNQHFDKTVLEVHCRSCCKEQRRLAEGPDHRHHGPDLHRNLHSLYHAQNLLLFLGVDRHLYCLVRNGDGICRDQDLTENHPSGQGYHMVRHMDGVDSFQKLKWVSSDMLL